jgi:hypothetical protein
MDLIQSLIYLPLGLIILALAATLSGLGAVEGVNSKGLEEQLAVTASADRSSAIPIAVDVSTTVFNTVRSALNRRIRLLLNNLVLAFRMVGWPALIFIATYGLAELSTNIQNYLHTSKSISDYVTYVLPAVGWGLAGLLGVVFSAALMLFRWRVADNTLRFLGLVGFIVLLTFWIFSLALWGFNQLLLQTGASNRHPFDPPSITTALSAAALIVFGILWGLRTLQGGTTVPKPVAPVPTGTPSGTSFSVSTPVDAAGSGHIDPAATQSISSEGRQDED